MENEFVNDIMKIAAKAAGVRLVDVRPLSEAEERDVNRVTELVRKKTDLISEIGVIDSEIQFLVDKSNHALKQEAPAGEMWQVDPINKKIIAAIRENSGDRSSGEDLLKKLGFEPTDEK